MQFPFRWDRTVHIHKKNAVHIHKKNGLCIGGKVKIQRLMSHPT